MTDLPEYISEELLAACRAELATLEVPANSASIFPALHGAAERAATACHDRYSYAVCAVFRLVAQAVGITYGSPYLSQVVHARHQAGELAARLKALAQIDLSTKDVP